MAPAESRHAQKTPRSWRQLASAFAAVAAITLGCVGCGGGGKDEPTTTIVTTTVTTTTHFPVDSPCVISGEVGKCVEYLNQQYMGFDPANESSPLGVAIRGQPRFNNPWFFCTQKCFNGQPDCYVAASLINHRVMLHDKVHTVAMPLNYPVGIVFQPSAVERHITRCAWQFDGAAFNRLNGGCGPGAPSRDCGKPGTAFANVCPSTGKAADKPAECPEIEVESCRAKPGSRYPNTCFWKGPAFYSSATPGAPYNLTEGFSEIREMMKQRTSDQSGKTMDGIPLLQYWDELTVDGKILEVMLTNNLAAAIAAVMYQRGNAQAIGYAQQYVEALEKDYGQKVHIVALDMNMRIGGGTPGPFSAPEEQLRVVV
mmetsp:Transcript_90057/g.268655  ORF Transcript_90057/g.268655 Transcript_90057/m.268655 type:complete len:370 (+) Transcript_90057:50-1159(+)